MVADNAILTTRSILGPPAIHRTGKGNMDTLFAIVILVGALFYLKSALGRWSRRRVQPSDYGQDQANERAQPLSGQMAGDEFEFDHDEQIAIDTELSRIARQLKHDSIRQADMIRIENGLAARALYRLAKEKYQNHGTEGAFATLYKSMAMDSSFEGQWLLLADIYAETNRVADAKKALRFAEEQFLGSPSFDLPAPAASPGKSHPYKETWFSQVARVKRKIQEAELDGGRA